MEEEKPAFLTDKLLELFALSQTASVNQQQNQICDPYIFDSPLGSDHECL